MQSFELKIFSGAAGLTELTPTWWELARRSGKHFLHFPPWYAAELANRPHAEVYFAACYSDGVLTAVLPFERVRASAGLPYLQLFYPNEMGVCDVLAERELAPLRARLLTALRRELPFFAVIRWQAIAVSGCAYTLATAGEFRPTHVSKYIAFAAGAEAYLATHSAKFRKGLFKKLRKAEEAGPLQLLQVREASELADAFAAFLAVEDSGWKGAGGSSIRAQPLKLAYYQALLDGYGGAGLCQINLLKQNDLVLAAQFGVRLGEQLFLLKIGFCEEYNKLSPGHLLLLKLIEASDQSGLRGISFVTGVDWIDRWHPAVDTMGLVYTGNGSLPSHWAARAIALALAQRARRKQASAPAVVAADSED